MTPSLDFKVTEILCPRRIVCAADARSLAIAKFLTCWCMVGTNLPLRSINILIIAMIIIVIIIVIVIIDNDMMIIGWRHTMTQDAGKASSDACFQLACLLPAERAAARCRTATATATTAAVTLLQVSQLLLMIRPGRRLLYDHRIRQRHAYVRLQHTGALAEKWADKPGRQTTEVKSPTERAASVGRSMKLAEVRNFCSRWNYFGTRRSGSPTLYVCCFRVTQLQSLTA